MSDLFYESREWLTARYQALKKSNGCCACCLNRPKPGNPLQVDHIKPRSKFPELELVIDNLQVLCRNCNLGKGNTDNIDWRSKDTQRQSFRPSSKTITYYVPSSARPSKRRAHIWLGNDDDTACHMWATGGITRKGLYRAANHLNNCELCSICKHNAEGMGFLCQ